MCPTYASRWWKDVTKLGDGGGSNWFNSEVSRNVGNGRVTRFWNDVWRGNSSFPAKYPRLFSLSNQKEGFIGDCRVSGGVGGNWDFSWRRDLFVWEEDLVDAMLEDLNGFVFSDVEDDWRWSLEEDGTFSVKSMYSKLETLMVREESLDELERRVFKHIWKSPAPSKVVVFSWKLLHDRIPTKINLAIRNCFPPDTSYECVWCNNTAEDATHLFLHCEGVKVVWCKIMEWLDFNFIIPPNLFILWECWNGAVLNNKTRKGVRIIWHAVIWSIWKARNDRIFNNAVIEVEDLLQSRFCLGGGVWED